MRAEWADVATMCFVRQPAADRPVVTGFIALLPRDLSPRVVVQASLVRSDLRSHHLIILPEMINHM